MEVERIVLNEQRNVTLTSYLLDVGGEYRSILKRPAVLVIPGGGYEMCSDREADPVALPYLKAGYHAFILRYSVKKDAVWPNPLKDYEQAMELIRSNAEKWHVYKNKIAVIGFSAGGHLAGCAATMSKNRPNAAILGYAVLGSQVKACLNTAPDTIAAVDSKTCPCFLFGSRTDDCVHISNTVRFMNALVEHDIAFESHIYAFGPHGYSTCDPSIQDLGPGFCDRMYHWVEDSIGWLGDVFGVNGPSGMTEPRCPFHLTADGKECLSIECTIKHLSKYEKAREIIDQIVRQVNEEIRNDSREDSRNQFYTREELELWIAEFKLSDMLNFFQMPDCVKEEVNQKLLQITNNLL